MTRPGRGGPGLIPRPVAVGIAVVIIGVWAASQLGALFVPGYQAPEAIHAAVMIVLGAVFSLRRDPDDDDEDDEDDEDDGPPGPVGPTPAQPPRQRAESAADMIARLQTEIGRIQREGEP